MEVRTHPLDVNKRTALVVDELSGELSTLLEARAHDVLEKTNEVGRVTDFLRVKDNFVGLSSLGEAGNDFVWHVSTKIDTKSQGQVMQANDATKLLAACQLPAGNELDVQRVI